MTETLPHIGACSLFWVAGAQARYKTSQKDNHNTLHTQRPKPYKNNSQKTHQTGKTQDHPGSRPNFDT